MRWPIIAVLSVTILALILVTTMTHGDMRIVVAKWQAGDEILLVMGVCDLKGGASVRIANPMTGQILGYTSTDCCGVWKMESKKESPPCRVIAVSAQEMSSIKSVTSSTGDCQ